MHNVKVDVKQLLETLKTNRVTHAAEFLEAVEGYKKALVTEIKAKLKAANAGKEVDHHIHLVKPVSYVEHYDDAISKLEWTTEKEVTLDSNTFRQFVLDKWDWKLNFTNSTASYIGAKKS